MLKGKACYGDSCLNSNTTGLSGSGQATVAFFESFSQGNEPPNCKTSAKGKRVWNAQEHIPGGYDSGYYLMHFILLLQRVYYTVVLNVLAKS